MNKSIHPQRKITKVKNLDGSTFEFESVLQEIVCTSSKEQHIAWLEKNQEAIIVNPKINKFKDYIL